MRWSERFVDLQIEIPQTARRRGGPAHLGLAALGMAPGAAGGRARSTQNEKNWFTRHPGHLTVCSCNSSPQPPATPNAYYAQAVDSATVLVHPFSLSLGHRRARRQDWAISTRDARITAARPTGRARPSRPAPKVQSHRARVALRNSRRSRASEIPCRYGSKSTRMDAACQGSTSREHKSLPRLPEAPTPLCMKRSPRRPGRAPRACADPRSRARTRAFRLVGLPDRAVIQTGAPLYFLVCPSS